ncbi:MAG TPA: hypothetical protein VFT84_06370 [Gemmatimonadales bacterium]|nr:hypothetical protein [Gemmatimonadales bacterium]
MPRRRRRVRKLSLFYFVVTLGLLVVGSLWLDRRGETAAAVIKSKHEEIIVHRVPRGGWDRYHRVGVEFPAGGGQLGMATITLPEARYDALHAGDTVRVHYLPLLPLLARAADRSTGQVVGDLAARVTADPWLLPFLFWLIGGGIALWIASRVATVAIVVAGLAWMALAFPIQFPASEPLPPTPVEATARVTSVTLITKAPARTRSRTRSRISRGTGESVRRLAMPYEVVQLLFAPDGRADSVLAVDAIDSASVAGLTPGAIVPIAYDPRSPREARMTLGSRTYRDRNRYHFLVPIMGLGVLGILGAWGHRHARVRRTRGAPAGEAGPRGEPSTRIT